MHFFGVDQLLPRNNLRASQPSFSLHVQGWKCVPVQSTGTDHTAWFYGFILLVEHTELCCLAASEGISLLATKKWLCKQWVYLHPTASRFLWLQDFSCIDSVRFFLPCSAGLDTFPTPNTEPAKKKKDLQAADLTLRNLLCLMGFLQEGVVEGFLSLGFPKTSRSSNAAGATFSIREKLFIFRAIDGAFWVALITYIKDFSVSFVWYFMCQPL